MDVYWKVLGGLLIAVILGMVLGKDISVMLSLAVCTMGTMVLLHYIQPVLTLLKQMEQAANFQGETFQILMKILGISLVSEIAAMVCNDAGVAGMGKLVKILTSVVILWAALPVFQTVLSLLHQILGEV